MESVDRLLLYRLRVVGVALTATAGAIVALLLYRALPGHQAVPLGPYAIVLALASVGALVISRLPWQRMFESAAGMRMLYLWSGFDIILVTALIVIQRTPRPDFFLLYFLTTVFFAASYPIRGQVALFLFTVFAAISGLLIGGQPLEPAVVFFGIGMLGLTAFMASFISHELRRELDESNRASSDAQQRARLLSIAAQAARQMSALDSEKVLGTLVDSALEIGFDLGTFCMLEENDETYRVVASRNMPREYLEAPHSADEGLMGAARRGRKTIVVDDYSSFHEAVPALRRFGIHAAVAAPVWMKSKLAGVLVAGRYGPMPLTVQEVEAFELIAAQAGVAVDNARAFEGERHALERLAELDRLKDDFVATASHELRTPVSVLIGMLESIHRLDAQLDDETRREFLDRSLVRARGLGHLIEDLLAVTHVEDGRMKLTLEQTPMMPLISRAVDNAGVADVVEIGCSNELTVLCDPLRMSRVVTNLLDNAKKYSPPGSRIFLNVAGRADSVEIRVGDEGPGIPADEREGLFDRLRRLSTAGNVTGFGLGLYIARVIVEAHHGTVTVGESARGGAEFVITLPQSAGQISSLKMRAADHGYVDTGSRRPVDAPEVLMTRERLRTADG